MAIVATLLVLGCDATKSATGALIKVEASGLTQVEAVVLKTDDGAEQRFEVAPEAAHGPHPVSPGHLRQHMAYGDRMVVRYREDGGRRVATAIDDAP